MVNFPYVRITNENNTDGIDLNDFDGYLMTSPTGFGIYRTSEYITVGNQRISTNNKPSFQKITFNIDIFGKRSEMENKYAVLRDFISRNIKEGFRLYYTPYEETRYINCDINIVDKTQKESAYLPIRLEVQPKSLWLSDVQKTTIKIQAEDEKMFAFIEQPNVLSVDKYNNGDKWYGVAFEQYPEITESDIYNNGDGYYGASFSIAVTSQAVLYNVGSETSPLTIRIYGYAVNPVVRLYKYGSSTASQVIEFDDVTIPDGYYLEINANPESTYIELVNSATGERIDREDYVKLESNIYMNLPTGNWLIDISDESGLDKCYADIFYTNQYYGG